MNDNTVFDQATNPHQYDTDKVRWEAEILVDSPFRKFFWEAFVPHLTDFAGRRVLDVGAGSGWLGYMLEQHGASSVLGIEPSHKNVLFGKQLYPDSVIIETGFEDFVSEELFDIAVFNMSISHMKSVGAVFSRLGDLLNTDGLVYIIAPDYDYFRTAKWGQSIEVTDISDDEYVVVANRSFNGIIADVVRKVSCFTDAGNLHGFSIQQIQPLQPSPSLITALPRYADYQDWAMAQMLIFKKLS